MANNTKLMISYTRKDLENGLILPDSDKGKEFGFTSERFKDGSYMWLKNGILFLSVIISNQEHKGYLLELLTLARDKGCHMAACPISGRMERILRKFGFKPAPSDYMTYFNGL